MNRLAVAMATRARHSFFSPPGRQHWLYSLFVFYLLIFVTADVFLFLFISKSIDDSAQKFYRVVKDSHRKMI